MKKNNFLEGAIIATFAIIACKIIGLLYVIPFYSIIGTQGGALYSYAYSIYSIFLGISIGGIPVAMSKIISEYNTLGYHNSKNRAFKIGLMIITGLGVLSCLCILLFAPQIAYLIIGDIEGGNSVESVAMVIRVVATALLIVPILSVTRGYLQGHKFITAPSIANVIEQIVRVIVILAGSFFALKVFNLSLDTAVGIAVFGATIGALVSYFYVLHKISQNKKELNKDAKITREEAHITNKYLVKKIIMYAMPFIFIDLAKSAYSMVDTFTVIKTMVNLGYSVADAETTIGVICTWAVKLKMIIISIALGLAVSLIPNIASSLVKKDYKDISFKVNQALHVLLYTTLPMTVGLSLLAGPVWTVFYGYDALSIDIFKIFIFEAITFSFYTVVIDLVQTMNNTKVTIIALVLSFLGKLVLNVPLMYLCEKIGLPVYFGPTIATLLTQAIAIIAVLWFLKFKYKLDYKLSIINGTKICLSTLVMVGVLLIMTLFIPIDATTRFTAIGEVILYSVVGVIIYLVVTYKTGLIEEVFGKKFINGIFKKLRIKKEI